MSCGGDNFIVPGANPCNNGGGGTAGVTTLNGFQGAVSITAGNPSIGVSNQGGNIVLTATGLQAVDSLNGVSGVVNIINGANTSVSTVGTDIAINVPTPVTSINSRTGAITLQGVGDTIVTNTGNTFFINTPAGVMSLNGVSGAMSISATGGTTLTTVGQGIFITSPISVTGINSLTGAVTINATGATSISQVGNTITINTPTVAAQTQLVKSDQAITNPIPNAVFADICSVPIVLTATSDIKISLTFDYLLQALPFKAVSDVTVVFYYNKNGGPFTQIGSGISDGRVGFDAAWSFYSTFNYSDAVTGLTAGNYIVKAMAYGLTVGPGATGYRPPLIDSISFVVLGNLA